MHAAAQPEVCVNGSRIVTPQLPHSNQSVQPDRGDWEFLMLAVGVLKARPSDVLIHGCDGGVASVDAPSAA